VLDAVDVAMTEASVGAGVSTVFLLATLHLTKSTELKPSRGPSIPLVFSTLVTVILIYGTFELPAFGLADAPVHVNVAPHYLSQSIAETTIPNVVTSVLGSYRGFDTLGETAVVFTAAIGVLMLLLRSRRPDGSADDTGDKS
jgi:multicomponent Na+:H+ antiporter subunit B